MYGPGGGGATSILHKLFLHFARAKLQLKVQAVVRRVKVHRAEEKQAAQARKGERQSGADISRVHRHCLPLPFLR